MVLTVLIPGLGHIYLRLWLRAILWLAIYVTATTLILPDGVTPDSLSFDAFVSAGESISPEAALLVFSITVFCILDAYMMTNHINKHVRRASGAAPTACPNCGKDLDEDLGFCHWCTTEFETQPEE